jgi:hypothetical protein
MSARNGEGAHAHPPASTPHPHCLSLRSHAVWVGVPCSLIAEISLFCARTRRPKPLAGEEHQFQFLVFLLIMIVLGLIVVVACTFRFEKHCL